MPTYTYIYHQSSWFSLGQFCWCLSFVSNKTALHCTYKVEWLSKSTLDHTVGFIIHCFNCSSRFRHRLHSESHLGSSEWAQGSRDKVGPWVYAFWRHPSTSEHTAVCRRHLSSSRLSCQHLLDMVDQWLQWSGMRAKVCKLQSRHVSRDHLAIASPT